jgi:hypothetical protein
MTFTRLLSAMAAVALLGACIPRSADEVATIKLDYLTSAQAEGLARPYLSENGSLWSSSDALNTITVRDRRENIHRIETLLERRDASPQNVSLHFQVVRATEVGSIDPALAKVGTALRELLRFEGYDLVAQTVVTAAERGVVEQSVDVGAMPLQLGVRINDVLGSRGNGSVDLNVELRRPGAGALLATNVVVPMGQTVVLGSAYPGSGGDALILTVRGEMGSARLRTTSRDRHDDAHVEAAVAAEAAHAEAALAAEAAAHEQLMRTQAEVEEVLRQTEMIRKVQEASARSGEARVVLPTGEVLGRDTRPATTKAAVSPPRAKSAVRPPGGGL